MTKAVSILRRLMIPLIIAAVVLISDQLSKAWVLQQWPQPYTGEIAIIPGWLELTYIRNTGVAFGLFQGASQLFTITSLVIVGVAIWAYLRHAPDNNHWLAISLGLIIGGAIGNVIDRVRFGYVVDFVKTLDGRFPVFNIADSCIVVGVFLMAIVLTYTEQQHSAQLPRAAEADDGV